MENKKIPYEELKQLKELLDEGVITSDEFDSKKRQMLGLETVTMENAENSNEKADSNNVETPVEQDVVENSSAVEIEETKEDHASNDPKTDPEPRAKDEDYLNGHIIDSDDEVGCVLRDINNSLSWFGANAIKEACDYYKQGFIEKKDAAKIEYDKVLYSRELITEVFIANKTATGGSYFASTYGNHYNNVAYDVGVISAPFSKALEKTELSGPGSGKLEENAAQHKEFQDSPPSSEALMKAEYIIRIGMAFSLDLET